MKKTFPLKAENNKPERVVEAIKKEVKKYIARERRKDLPQGFDYWGFDCKIGLSAKEAKPFHVAEINKKISEVASQETESLYLEVLAKKMIREPKG